MIETKLAEVGALAQSVEDCDLAALAVQLHIERGAGGNFCVEEGVDVDHRHAQRALLVADEAWHHRGGAARVVAAQSDFAVPIAERRAVNRQPAAGDQRCEARLDRAHALRIRLETMDVIESPLAVERDAQGLADMGADIDENVHASLFPKRQRALRAPPP